VSEGSKTCQDLGMGESPLVARGWPQSVRTRELVTCSFGLVKLMWRRRICESGHFRVVGPSERPDVFEKTSCDWTPDVKGSLSAIILKLTFSYRIWKHLISSPNLRSFRLHAAGDSRLLRIIWSCMLKGAISRLFVGMRAADYYRTYFSSI
jgi:hypothetical protein